MADNNKRLLSAPDEVRGDEEEVNKHAARKAALEKAKIERQNSELRCGNPTIEDMLGDVVRVATDEDTNPWHEFRTCGQRRYELYGHYPVDTLLRKWGRWSRVMEVAGIYDEPGTKQFKTGRAEASKREHVGRYVERYVRPFVVQHERFRQLGSPYLILSINDTHGVHLDPFTWQCFLSAIRDLRPDCVLLNGDILDGSALSRYPKVPGWDPPLEVELELTRTMIEQIRQFHEGDLIFGGGNHGVDRLANYLAQVAPALAGLPSLRIDELLGLGEFNVELAHQGTKASPLGEEDYRGGMLMFGFYRWHHGTKLGQHPAAAELRAAGRSGQSGHVHRAQLFYGTNEAEMGKSWMCVPMGCSDRAGRQYMKGVTTGWQKGFGIAYLYPGGDVHQYPVVTDNDRCTIEGHIYQRTEEVMYDPPANVNWLKDIPLP